jgi:hypothetical protein
VHLVDAGPCVPDRPAPPRPVGTGAAEHAEAGEPLGLTACPRSAGCVPPVHRAGPAGAGAWPQRKAATESQRRNPMPPRRHLPPLHPNAPTRQNDQLYPWARRLLQRLRVRSQSAHTQKPTPAVVKVTGRAAWMRAATRGRGGARPGLELSPLPTAEADRLTPPSCRECAAPLLPVALTSGPCGPTATTPTIQPSRTAAAVRRAQAAVLGKKAGASSRCCTNRGIGQPTGRWRAPTRC